MAVSVPNVRRLLLCLTGAVVLSACGDNSVQQDAPAAVATPAAATAPATATVTAVPDSLAFSAPLVGGGTLDFADYAGTPLLVWFWAPT
jgi:hypothetical protein